MSQTCEPWFNGDILEMINNRDKAGIRFPQNKDDTYMYHMLNTKG